MLVCAITLLLLGGSRPWCGWPDCSSGTYGPQVGVVVGHMDLGVVVCSVVSLCSVHVCQCCPSLIIQRYGCSGC